MSNRFACVLGSNGPPWDNQLEFAEKDVERIQDTLQNLCGFSVSLAPTADARIINSIDFVEGFCLSSFSLEPRETSSPCLFNSDSRSMLLSAKSCAASGERLTMTV